MINTNYYLSIASINCYKQTKWSTQKSIRYPSNPDHDKCKVQNIIQCYKNHPSIIKIKENVKKLAPFDFPKPNAKAISLIIKSLNPKKATGSDPSKSYQICFKS